MNDLAAEVTAALEPQHPALGHRPRRRPPRRRRRRRRCHPGGGRLPGRGAPDPRPDRGADPRRRTRRHRRPAGPGPGPAGPPARHRGTSPRPPAPSSTPRSTRRSPPTAATSPSPAPTGAGSASASKAAARAAAWPRSPSGRASSRCCGPACPRMTGLDRRHRPRGGHRAVLLPGETVTAPARQRRRPRVLLLVPARTYRAADFILAAERMGLDLVVASDGALPLGGRPVIPVRPGDLEASARRILARSRAGRRGRRRRHPDARAGRDRGRPDGAAAQPGRRGARRHRQGGPAAALGRGRRAQPSFRLVPAAEDCVRQAAEAVGFPCVVKAVSLSASQGVLRADDPAAAVTGRPPDPAGPGMKPNGPPPSPCSSRSTCPAPS